MALLVKWDSSSSSIEMMERHLRHPSDFEWSSRQRPYFSSRNFLQTHVRKKTLWLSRGFVLKRKTFPFDGRVFESQEMPVHVPWFFRKKKIPCMRCRKFWKIEKFLCTLQDFLRNKKIPCMRGRKISKIEKFPVQLQEIFETRKIPCARSRNFLKPEKFRVHVPGSFENKKFRGL